MTVPYLFFIAVSAMILSPCESFFPYHQCRTGRFCHFGERLWKVAASPSSNQDDAVPNVTRIYFDISANDEPLGRLVFSLASTEKDPNLPLHTENLIKLCTSARKSIDPKCTYLNCQFQHSPQSVEGYPQYRWAHVLQGSGRNAVGPPTERIVDRMAECTHKVYGGDYYGMKYEEEYGVVLTVPLVGPFRGSTGFSIVRVGESPREWRERLLLNSAVLGRLDSGIETLRDMARQVAGPPVVVDSGVL